MTLIKTLLLVPSRGLALSSSHGRVTVILTSSSPIPGPKSELLSCSSHIPTAAAWSPGPQRPSWASRSPSRLCNKWVPLWAPGWLHTFPGQSPLPLPIPGRRRCCQMGSKVFLGQRYPASHQRQTALTSASCHALQLPQGCLSRGFIDPSESGLVPPEATSPKAPPGPGCHPDKTDQVDMVSRRGQGLQPGRKELGLGFLSISCLTGWKGSLLRGDQRSAPFLLCSATTLCYKFISTVWHLERKGIFFKTVFLQSSASIRLILFLPRPERAACPPHLKPPKGLIRRAHGDLPCAQETYLRRDLQPMWWERRALARWLSGKESACQCRRPRVSLWVRRIPWRRAWQPAPLFLAGEFHRQRCLVGWAQGTAKSWMNGSWRRSSELESERRWPAPPGDGKGGPLHRCPVLQVDGMVKSEQLSPHSNASLLRLPWGWIWQHIHKA